MRPAAGIGLVHRQPAYRCRHGHTSATRPNPTRPKNLYVREDQILPHLATLAILHANDDKVPRSRKQAHTHITAPAHAADLINQLHAARVSLTYDPATKTLRADTNGAVAIKTV